MGLGVIGALLGALVFASACGSGSQVAKGKDSLPRPVGSGKPSRSGAYDDVPGSVPSIVLTTAGSRTIGPYVARHANGWLAVQVAAATGGGSELSAIAELTNGGASDKRSILRVPTETRELVARGHGDTVFASWSALLDRGSGLSVIALSTDGFAKGPAAEIARTNDHIVWHDVIPTAAGAVVVWTEETRASDGIVLAAAVGADGQLRGAPSRVARGVTGWQAIPFAGGVGVALVTPAGGRTGASARAGTLSWQRLDADARATGAPVAIATTPTVSSDVEVAATGDGALFAWTDATSEDPEVRLAGIDSAGKVSPPRAAFTPRLAARLSGLAAGKAGALIAWEEARQRGRPARTLHLASISSPSDPTLTPGAALSIRGTVAPLFAALDDGFGVVMRTVACAAEPSGGSARDADESECAQSIVAPTFVRLDAKMGVVETHPIRLGTTRESASLVWGLDCAGRNCRALAATPESPTPVRLLDLSPRASGFRTPTLPPISPDAPRIVETKTVAAGDTFADVVATAVGDSTFVATVTASAEDPSAAKQARAKGATLTLRVLNSKGEPQGTTTTVTTRAVTSGGIAIAEDGKSHEGAAIAWVARDGNDTQVHVSRIDKHGRRVNEIQLTGGKGGVHNVALAWADGGWVVAWVDNRDGNGEVYAAKIDPDLNRYGREERLTRAAGDAADLSLATAGDKVWIVWADPRDTPAEGTADIFVASVRARDARPLLADVRVHATAAHSRSPAIAASGDGAVLGWIEEAPSGLEGGSANGLGAFFTRIDAKGKSASDPSRLRLAGEGRAIAVTLDASRGKGFRAYVARAAADEVVIDAAEFDESLAPKISPLTTLDGPTALEATIARVGDALFYCDQSASTSERRVKRAVVGWRR